MGRKSKNTEAIEIRRDAATAILSDAASTPRERLDAMKEQRMAQEALDAIAMLRQELAAAKQEISALTTARQGLQEQFTALTERATALQREKDSLTGEIAEHAQRLNEAKTQSENAARSEAITTLDAADKAVQNLVGVSLTTLQEWNTHVDGMICHLAKQENLDKAIAQNTRCAVYAATLKRRWPDVPKCDMNRNQTWQEAVAETRKRLLAAVEPHKKPRTFCDDRMEPETGESRQQWRPVVPSYSESVRDRQRH